MKKILAIILFLLFLLLVWFTNDKYQECCESNDDETNETTSKSEVKKDGPLVFKWQSGEAITNDLWRSKKNEILSGMSDQNILKIAGPYFGEEGKDMGLLRAKNTMALFKGRIDDDKVELGSKLMSPDANAKTSNFEGVEFRWLIRNKNIQQIDDITSIYFPNNSTQKLSNVNIINYLKNVAKSLEGNTKKVVLSGHSDNVGNAIKNKQLALGRANSIKAELVRFGVDINRITTISYGEEKPIETNDTKDGRQKNRRVELEIK
jgi:outer membrane protein OmpA-like peptidoglycan-associated protein